MSDAFPHFIPPMLATPGSPRDSEEFICEPKWDGIRCQALFDGSLRLLSRNGNNVLENFPEMAPLAQLIKGDSWVLDGELIVLDESRRPSFDMVRDRNLLKDEVRIRRVSATAPATLVCFDLLYYNGHSHLAVPLQARRNRLGETIPENDLVITSPGTVGGGLEFHRAAVATGLEGTVCKKLSSPYYPGHRSKEWIKVRATRQADCVVAGYTPKGTAFFGSLLLGQIAENGELVYIGHVGTGFSHDDNSSLTKVLKTIQTTNTALTNVPRVATRGVVWVEPRLVCIVEYLAWTNAGVLRHPAFKGFRMDKQPEECLLEPDHPSLGKSGEKD